MKTATEIRHESLAKRGGWVRPGGGVYVYRTRKPSSLIGLIPGPWVAKAAVALVLGAIVDYLLGVHGFIGLFVLLCSGRHFAYVGETVSFKDRHGEHMSGGGRWKKGAAPWSDLDAVCVLRIPLGTNKTLLRFVETILIFLLQPVYNEKKNKWNLRRITRPSARRMRKRRDRRSVKLNVLNFRSAHFIVVVSVLIALHNVGVI